MPKYLLFIFLLVFNFLFQQYIAVAQHVAPVSSSVSPFWEEAENYTNGFARVLKNNQFGFIDKTGKLICPVAFDGARNFSNQLAAVQKDNRWGFINQAGKIVIPIHYTIVFDFTANVTAVYNNKNWLLINMAGETVKQLDIDVFYGFKNGKAMVSKNGKWGNVNTRGDIVFTSETATAPLLNKPLPKPQLPSFTTGISVCPDNIDFEYGSFLNWQCFTGQVDSVGNTNVITVIPSIPTVNRHTLYSRSMPSLIDPFGLFPINPPDGSNFALKLGNTQIGAQAEKVRYPIHVPINDSNFSVKYDYAVVFEDPGHTTWTQPRFQVSVIDSATNTAIQCATFEYISTSSLPGFARSTVDTGVMYKPWSTVFLSLRGYAGKTMYLDFTNADCVRRGHWGYSYIDVEKPCGQSVEINYDCDSPHVTTLSGPPGFNIYNWWDSAFTTILGTGQQLVLNPGPAINTTIWLEMIPFNNFGCVDTLPVKISGVFTANFNISDTSGVCAPHAFTFYNPYLPAISTSWDFGDGTTGTGDTITHVYNLPGTYLAKFNVSLPNGCIGSGYKLVTITQPVGSFSFDGTFSCASSTVKFDAVTNNADSLFWNFGDGTTLQTKQTTVFHTYTAPGVYIPTLQLQALNGCVSSIPATDTVRIEMLNAGFTYTQVKVCGSTTLNFTDTSYSYFGINARRWNFGDGSTASGAAVSHTYTVSGIYTIQLIITGISGCKDTVNIPVNITVNALPVASVGGPVTLCQGTSFTLTSNVISADAVNYYHWTASNGSSGAASTFTTVFNQPGAHTVQLVVGTVNGCFDTAIHQITINPMPNVVTVPNQTLCSGTATNPINFSGAVAGTTYNWTNTNTLIGLGASGSGTIASFMANTTGDSINMASITVTPVANGCPGNSKTFVITVNPVPTVTQPTDQLLCNNTNTAAITFSRTVAGSVYQWTNNNTLTGLAAFGTGNIASFTALNTGTTPSTARVTVRPVANGCSGQPKTFSIVVKPTPDVAQPGSQVLCNNSTASAINFIGTVGGTVYNWTNSNTTIGLAASGAGNITSFTAINTDTAVAVATVQVNPMANGCPGLPKTFTITVNPVHEVMQPVNQSLCNNSNTAGINFSGTVPGTSFTWVNTNPSIGLAANGNGNIAIFKAINKTALAVTASITVMPVASVCPGLPKVFDIIVHPTPDVDAAGDGVVCLGKTIQLNATGALQYTWSPANYLNCTNCSSPTASPADSIVYTVTGTNAAGCMGYDSVLLNVIKPFAITVSPNDTLCYGESSRIRAFNASSYLWSPPAGLNRTNIADPTVKTGITTTYRVIGFDNHQCFTDTGFVTIVVGPKPAVNIGPDRTLTAGTTLTLNAITQGGPIISWLWSPAAELSCNNCISPSTTVRNNAFYTVTVTNTFGCIATDTVFINSLCKSAEVFIPNAFTPDGDGLNDVLMVRGRGVTVKSFRIFNRWGELVFERENFYPNEAKFGWDGKVRGVPATPDVFVYTAEVYCDNNVLITYKGNTTILK